MWKYNDECDTEVYKKATIAGKTLFVYVKKVEMYYYLSIGGIMYESIFKLFVRVLRIKNIQICVHFIMHEILVIFLKRRAWPNGQVDRWNKESIIFLFSNNIFL